MKNILIPSLGLVGSVCVFAQVAIDFDNRVPTLNIDAPVFRPDGTGAGAGFTAGLFLVRGEGSLEPLFPTTTFFTSRPEFFPYTVPTIIWLSDARNGDWITVRLRAWETAAGAYETALIRGESKDIELFLHSEVPVSLLGLQGFTMVPEPSPGALLALGGAALLALAPRRRQPAAGAASVPDSPAAHMTKNAEREKLPHHHLCF